MYEIGDRVSFTFFDGKITQHRKGKIVTLFRTGDENSHISHYGIQLDSGLILKVPYNNIKWKVI